MLKKRIQKIFEHELPRVKSITFHPEKPVFLTALHNGAICAWDYLSNTQVCEFLGHEGSVRSVVFHPRGDFFISGGDDKIIRMWDYTKRTVIRTFTGHHDFIRSLDFHPSKVWFASCSDDQTVRIWNFMTGKCLGTVSGHSHYVMSVRFVSEIGLISASLDQSIRVWDISGLYSGKSSAIVPDIVIKQVISGHERGINTISVHDSCVVTRSDDKDVKVWTFKDFELLEKKIYCNHQGFVTSVVVNEDCIASVGEDGIVCFHSLSEGLSKKVKFDTRFWCIENKDEIYAMGHDSGIKVYMYTKPKMVTKAEGGFYYTKNDDIYFTNLKTEDHICKLNGELLYIQSVGKYLLLQYINKYEVLVKGKVISHGNSNTVLVKDGNDVSLILKDEENVYFKRNCTDRKEFLFSSLGDLVNGSGKHFYIADDKVVRKYNMKDEVGKFLVGYKATQVVDSENRVAIISKNNLSLFNSEGSALNTIDEVVNINGGFFIDDVFVYATSKHIKYLFEHYGIIKSVDSQLIPFCYQDEQVYCMSNGFITSIDVDITEIEFKEAVTNNEDIKPFVEERNIPGLSPLSFIIRMNKGNMALPYIKDARQRFELSLSEKEYEKCLEYCRSEKSEYMYRKLSKCALEDAHISVAEECLYELKEYYKIFMLYVCSKQVEKMPKLYKVADEHTRQMILLFFESTDSFFKTKTNKNSDFNVKKIGDEISIEVKNNLYADKSTSSLKKVENEDTDSSLEGKEGTRFSSKSNKSSVSDFKKDEVKNSKTKVNQQKTRKDASFDKDVQKSIESLNIKGDKYGEDTCLGIFSLSRLEQYTKFNSQEDIKVNIASGLECTTKGVFQKAIECFSNSLYSIAFYISDNLTDSYVEERKMLGAYISGLSVEYKRREEESDYKNILMAEFFASLPLEDNHALLAKSGLVYVCIKKGNFKRAKEVASVLKSSSETVPKVVNKAMAIKEDTNKYEVPNGKFCYDILDVSEDHGECKFCFVVSANKGVCSLCGIGYVQ